MYSVVNIKGQFRWMALDDLLTYKIINMIILVQFFVVIMRLLDCDCIKVQILEYWKLIDLRPSFRYPDEVLTLIISDCNLEIRILLMLKLRYLAPEHQLVMSTVSPLI